MKLEASELRSMGPHLSVGIHAADPAHLGDELDRMSDAGIGMIHLDIMDGVWCPQMTFGPAFVVAIDDRFIKDVHLMVADPLDKLDWFVNAGASLLTFHLEGTLHPRRGLQALAGTGVLRGVAIGPGTPLELVAPLVDDLEYVLLVTIDPGWPGQRLDPRTKDRLGTLRHLIGNRPVLVGVDGGVNRANLAEVAALGADVVVSGSAVFDGSDTAGNARSMLEELRGAASTSAGNPAA